MDKQWWYSTEGKRKGPLSFEEICDLFADGTLTTKTLVWTKGQDAWAPLSEVEEFEDALNAVPPEPPQPTVREKNIELPLAGPWRRFFARIIDLWAISLPTAFLVSYILAATYLEFYFWMQEPGSEVLFGWLIIPLVLLVEAIIYGVCGTTLGKAILGIKVTTVSAYKVTFSQYARRLVGTYVIPPRTRSGYE